MKNPDAQILIRRHIRRCNLVAAGRLSIAQTPWPYWVRIATFGSL